MTSSFVIQWTFVHASGISENGLNRSDSLVDIVWIHVSMSYSQMIYPNSTIRPFGWSPFVSVSKKKSFIGLIVFFGYRNRP